MVYRLTLFQHSYLVERFYGKTSTRQIALDFRNNFCLPISAPTVLRKTVEMTKTAIEVMSYLIKTDPAFLPRVGDIWEIDETYFNLGKKETTLIVVKDLKTCYFLAANLERASNIETTTKAFLENGTVAIQTYSWSNPGIYTKQEDRENGSRPIHRRYIWRIDKKLDKEQTKPSQPLDIAYTCRGLHTKLQFCKTLRSSRRHNACRSSYGVESPGRQTRMAWHASIGQKLW